MVHTTPLVLPQPQRPGARRFNRRSVLRAIRRATRRLGPIPDGPVQIWTFAPDTAFLAGHFQEERFVYYCVDEHAQFLGFDPDYIAREERAQIDLADVLITTSTDLHETKAPRHPNAHLVRHGVDVNHFNRAWQADLPLPADVADLPRPLVGFFGVLHHWIDRALLAAVARRRPQYTFVLLGEVLADATCLRALPNVHLLGRRPYASLPAYCRAFDAALLPFERTTMTRSVNPIKMREYLAAGLPVVSTELPEARRYAPDILMADEPESFARACDQALGRTLAPRGEAGWTAPRRHRAAQVAEESWENVVERLSTIIQAPLPSRACPAVSTNSLPGSDAGSPPEGEEKSAARQPLAPSV